MAFEITDFFRSYTPRGEMRGLFNVARSDPASAGLRYYAYFNEAGSYIIQRQTTSGTVKIYEYYARKEAGSDFATDWANRASLTYVEYYELFKQGD